MIAIDTNVLVRLLVADDPEQASRARKLVAHNDVVIATTVLLECAWVLRATYGFHPAEIASAIRKVLGLPNVAPEAPVVVAHALDACDAGLDFADALHLAGVTKARTFFTFDGRLVKAARRLGVSTVAPVPA